MLVARRARAACTRSQSAPSTTAGQWAGLPSRRRPTYSGEVSTPRTVKMGSATAAATWASVCPAADSAKARCTTGSRSGSGSTSSGGGADREWPDREGVTRPERPQVDRLVEHAWAVEGQDGV